MNLLDSYKIEMFQNLKLIYPDVDENLLKDFIIRVMKKKHKNPVIEIHNNYEETTRKTKLNEFSKEIDTIKPILVESGMLFKQHSESVNLPLSMLESLSKERKEMKKLMIKAMDEKNIPEREYYNLRQSLIKIFNNSYYGVIGEPNSQYHNRNIAESVTLKSRSIIISALITFERFLSNNIYFRSFDDFFLFVRNVINEVDTTKNDKTVLSGFVTREFIVQYLKSRFVPGVLNDINTQYIETTVDNILKMTGGKSFTTRLYLKNNFYKFCKLNKVKDLLGKVLFGDNSLKDELFNRVSEYVLYNYQMFDKVHYFDNLIRKSIILIDTDSTMINIEPWIDFIEENFDVERSKDNVFRSISVLVDILTGVISNNFKLLTSNSGVIDELRRNQIGMKNEFLYKRMLLTEGKKNYAGSKMLQEGVELDPPELDIKGLMIKKIVVAKGTREYFSRILEEDILIPDKIDISLILDKIDGFENHIKDELKKGNTRFLSPDKVNGLDSYIKPLTQSGVRGVLLWNFLYPSMEIRLPSNVNYIKLKTKTLEDFEKYGNMKQKFPDIYEKIEKFLCEPEMNHYGITYICFPKNLKEIPEWVIPYMDLDKVVADNVKTFTPVLNSLGLKLLKIKSTDCFHSNILNL